ncbi:MAG: amino acid adenylation domain-containing protein, partial [bacterium]|nr:amino acid adenylation domain-containing protein [bacterium]
MLSEEEKKQLLVDFNDTGAEYPTGKTIHQLFEAQVQKTPDSISIVGKNHLQHPIQLTYMQLNEEAESLAIRLHEQGVAKNELVGLLADRNIGMLTGMLAILKTGCGYVPLNPKAPAERNKYMLDECAVNLLLTVASLEKEAKNIDSQRNIICVETRSPQLTADNHSPLTGNQPSFPNNQSPITTNQSFAYVIFTSGSTGKPKGVPITHSNFSQLVHWGHRELGIGSDDRALQNLSYYFDWSVWEIFITLTTGAGLYMISDELQMDSEASAKFIEKNKITVLHATPTQWQYLLPSRAGTDGNLIIKKRLQSISHLFIGAEKLPYDLVERSIEAVTEKTRIFNMYGPTEATIISAVLEVDKEKLEHYKNLSSVPIGKPTGNSRLLVLDKNLKPVPLKVEGELYIGGEGVAGGYLNNPELSAARFVETSRQYAVGSRPSFPNNQYPITNNHLYRTGDRARWLPDGTVEFLGRLDFQVKIRGFRIELGEIENQLLNHEDVSETVVVAREDEPGEHYLCAYYVPKGKSQEQETLATGLQEYLAQKLPDYMVPAHYVPIEAIPLNPNGKVDLKALDHYQIAKFKYQKQYTAPRNELEKKLLEIWTRVLTLEAKQIGIDDSFFQLGGHSLKATRLAAQIHKHLEVSIPLSQLFESPTIRALSHYIETAAADKFYSIQPVEKKEFYPISSTQRRLYIMQQKAPTGTAYNITAAMELKGELETAKLETIFNKLVKQHESLRTTFP